MSVVNKRHEELRIETLKEENKKLLSEINIVKKELIKRQVANCVPQVSIQIRYLSSLHWLFTDFHMTLSLFII